MTPYLTGTFQLIWYEKEASLANGQRLRMQVSGTLSLELGASAQVSLWTQSANVQADNHATLTIIYSLRCQCFKIKSTINLKFIYFLKPHMGLHSFLGKP